MLNEEIPVYRKRIDYFRQTLNDYLFPETILFKARYLLNPDKQSVEQHNLNNYQPIAEGEIWGEKGQTALFYLKAQMPLPWQGKEVVALLNFGGEALVQSNLLGDAQGLANGSIYDPAFKREIYPFSRAPEANQKIELWVEAVASSLFGQITDNHLANPPHAAFKPYQARVEKLRLALFDRQIWHLMLDFDVLIDLLDSLPENSVRFLRILRALNLAVSAFADNPANASAARQELQTVLKQPAHASELTAYAVGHAHIDTAWLWPVRETVRKCIRTFANQVRLLKEYPEYIFGASQPQHYAFVKKHAPQLYQEIRTFVRQGRWELQGGMWVEADCNLISGESMVRQILHGKNFFNDEFGIEVKNLWLPDVFGYSAALPQILQKSGIDYFLTQKLSWNAFNTFPYTTFLWEGMDGSRVLAHFPPESVYDSKLTPSFLIRGRDQFKEKDILDVFISLFGMGDGGGGPKAEHIEYGRRQANLEGVPRVVFSSAERLFERLNAQRDALTVWRGELFLEMHLGTLTSHAQIKKNNRRLEFSLRATEILWSCLPLKEYPAQALDTLWKKTLINQFHDILPGSAIGEVYRQVQNEQDEALKQCEILREKAAQKLFIKDSGALVLFNTLPFEYSEVMRLPAGFETVFDDSGAVPETQPTANGTLVRVNLPALGAVTLHKSVKTKRAKTRPSHATADLILENELIRYTFDENGQLIEIWDKEAQRSVLKSGQRGNVLQLFIDRPAEWDAWEIDYFYEQQLQEEAQTVQFIRLENGPLRQALQFEFKIGHSKIVQNIYLKGNCKRLDFDTQVNWNETHRMLRVYFEADIQNDRAGFDIQYGYLVRPVHRNTSWDRARYEVSGHKFADISQPDYGVAVLNDSKYGYKVFIGGISLNLLRSPTYPDPQCDRGNHRFVYALLPHSGDLTRSVVMRESWKLNQKPLLFKGFKSHGRQLLPFSVSGKGIRLETFKKAEKESVHILRLVEGLGRKTIANLCFNRLPLKIEECDLLEWRTFKPLKVEKELSLSFNPFEIRTFKIDWGE